MMNGVAGPDATAQPAKARMMKIEASRGLKGFLDSHGVSIAFTTYQSGRLMLVGGNKEGNRLHFSESRLKRPMGLAVGGRRMAVAAKGEIVFFVNALDGARVEGGAVDSLFCLQSVTYTSDIDTHDVAFAADGRLYFINTMFSCLCTTSDGYSFKPVWKPNFISGLASEDRCHLNGLAMRDGKPAYVTACATTDAAHAWKDDRIDRGVIIDVHNDSTVCTGLTMPHSPRWHNGQLWVLDSGRGQLGTVDFDRGRIEPKLFLPGYLRGLTFFGDHALVGLSRPREGSVFSGLPLQDELDARGVEPVCGIYIVNLKNLVVEHSLVLEGDISELYDTVILPNSARPSMFTQSAPKKQRLVMIEPGLS